MLILLIISTFTINIGICQDCDFLKSLAENIKTILDYNSRGFRYVFPRSYNVSYYTADTSCNDELCCIFPDALLLAEAWSTLLRDLWHQHLNYSLIVDVRHMLLKITKENKNMDQFQEENNLSELLPLTSSTPEELLNKTSIFLKRWLDIDCKSGALMCIPVLSVAKPTLNIDVIQKKIPSSTSSIVQSIFLILFSLSFSL
ncbi:hypothetical protein LDVICp163 [lymphocystis disease virus-China]|uniref:Uncharacterized protein n=2 Tax=Lymphocystis disease virus 2 TaxID=159183 RepID=A0A6F8X1R0_9VIRU|nr:hypothetical protein LDVICp163 [lymphocystis disease virus-China]AAU11008.1 hypothetical protein [lymphocystis disease virus-China]BCB67510.1 hypothetical protein [Lymphocystis disease virus 2]